MLHVYCKESGYLEVNDRAVGFVRAGETHVVHADYVFNRLSIDGDYTAAFVLGGLAACLQPPNVVALPMDPEDEDELTEAPEDEDDWFTEVDALDWLEDQIDDAEYYTDR